MKSIMITICLMLAFAGTTRADGVLNGPTSGADYTVEACAGTNASDKCYCTQTRATATWSGVCPAGYYCPYQNATQISCNKGDNASNAAAGFYCPANTQTPVYCCEGFKCPNSTSIEKCSSGNFCKVGSINEKACPWSASCPEGTSNPSNMGPLVFMVLIVALAWFIHFKVSNSVAVDNKAHAHQLEMEETSAKQAARTGAVEDTVDRTGEFNETFDFKFKQLGLTLPNGITIMKGVNGTIRHGKVTAIMGPSGAGKTTFLSLLSGKVPNTKGKIFIRSTLDGEFVHEPDGVYKFRKLVGFVPQEDVMLREMRVIDNIKFSGAFRLPSDMSNEQIDDRTEEVIKTLGLGGVAVTPIGDETTRGVSGGQRKRVNIGMELVANPRILFLDEPTSGLDSTSSQEVMSALGRIAKEEGMTIMAVIHQPRLEIYNEIDDLLLLGKGGQTVYIGPREEAADYFASLGFVCEDAATNPIDFFMDVISGDIARAGYPDFAREDLFDLWEDHAKEVANAKPLGEPITKNKQWFTGKPQPIGSGSASTSLNLNDRSNVGSGSGLSTEVAMAAQDGVAAEAELGAGDSQVEAEADSSSSNSDSDDESTVDVQPNKKEKKEPKEKNCCAKCCDCFKGFFVETYMDIKNWWVDFAVFLYNSFIAPWTPGYRATASAPVVFWLVLQRSWRQTYRNFGRMVAENALHLFLGLVMATFSSDGVTLTGPIPAGAVELCPYELGSLCTNPVIDGYIGMTGFLCWSIGFAGIAVGAGTFGNEKIQFWREQGAGMNFIVYFYAKLVSDIPRIGFAAFCFTAAFTSGFASESTFGRVYACVLLMYYSGFALGYLTSAFCKPEMAALVGVAISMLFAIALSGANSPSLKEVNDSDSGIVHFIFFLSYARWGTEAFYVNEAIHFDYMDIEPYLTAKGFVASNGQFYKCLLNMFLQALVWQAVALVFLKMNNRQSQKLNNEKEIMIFFYEVLKHYFD